MSFQLQSHSLLQYKPWSRKSGNNASGPIVSCQLHLSKGGMGRNFLKSTSKNTSKCNWSFTTLCSPINSIVLGWLKWQWERVAGGVNSAFYIIKKMKLAILWFQKLTNSCIKMSWLQPCCIFITQKWILWTFIVANFAGVTECGTSFFVLRLKTKNSAKVLRALENKGMVYF